MPDAWCKHVKGVSEQGDSAMSEYKYFEFPGDNELPREGYGRLLKLDPTYLAMAGILDATSASFGLDVSLATKERWLRVAGVMDHFDTIVDDIPDGSPGRADSLALFEKAAQSVATASGTWSAPEALSQDAILTCQLVQNAMQPLSMERRKLVQGSALSIGRLAAQKFAARTVAEYVRVGTREGRLAGYMFADCVSDEEATQAEFGKFHEWMANLGVLSVRFDSAQDLKEDFKKGRTSLSPTRLHQLELLATVPSAVIRLFSKPAAVKAFITSVGQQKDNNSRQPSS